MFRTKFASVIAQHKNGVSGVPLKFGHQASGQFHEFSGRDFVRVNAGIDDVLQAHIGPASQGSVIEEQIDRECPGHVLANDILGQLIDGIMAQIFLVLAADNRDGAFVRRFN